jgi:hypothetical protein
MPDNQIVFFSSPFVTGLLRATVHGAIGGIKEATVGF